MVSEVFNLFEQYGFIPKKVGTTWRSICPKCSHDRKKKNEMCVALDMYSGVYYCHHCGESGAVKKNNFKTFDYSRHINNQDKMYQWFAKRGISRNTVDAFNITFDGKWIKFPYYLNNKVVNIKYRTFDKQFKQKSGDKIIRPFYNHNVLRNKEIIIVEGEMDVLACYEAGLTNVVSVPNGANLAGPKTPDFLKYAKIYLDQCKTIFLATDNDEKGNILADELARRIGKYKCKRVYFPEKCKDANEALLKFGGDGLRDIIYNKSEFYKVDGIFYLADNINRIINFKNKIKELGLGTGIDELDNYIKFLKNELVIITGIPGSGKSEFIDYLAINFIKKYNWKFLYFSSENVLEELALKFSYKFLEKKTFTDDEIKETLSNLSDYIRIVDFDKIKNHKEILEKAEELIYQDGINCIVIDPYNTLEHKRNKNENETDYISRFLEDLRSFSKKYDVIIFVVAHPTKIRPLNPNEQKTFKNLYKKQGKYEMPSLYSISGSANWFNKADIGLILYRYEDNITRLFIDKIRRGYLGEKGWVDFKYCKESWSFEPIAHGKPFKFVNNDEVCYEEDDEIGDEIPF